jgi:hypothetical protein
MANYRHYLACNCKFGRSDNAEIYLDNTLPRIAKKGDLPHHFERRRESFCQRYMYVERTVNLDAERAREALDRQNRLRQQTHAKVRSTLSSYHFTPGGDGRMVSCVFDPLLNNWFFGQSSSTPSPQGHIPARIWALIPQRNSLTSGEMCSYGRGCAEVYALAAACSARNLGGLAAPDTLAGFVFAAYDLSKGEHRTCCNACRTWAVTAFHAVDAG